MRIERALEHELTRVGAKRVEVRPDGVASHWLTLPEAQKAKARFEEISFANFGRAPDRIEIFHDKGLFACFVLWPKTKKVFRPYLN